MRISDWSSDVCSSDLWIINGEQTWISNGAIADVLTLFARGGEAPGAKGLSAFVFPTATEGFSVTERIDVIAPHQLATIRFDNCFLPDDPPTRTTAVRARGWRYAYNSMVAVPVNKKTT